MNALILATEKTASFMFAEAQIALQDGTLEIEGYECVQWIKFDPNDESTFPPKNGKRIMIAYEQSNNSDKWEVMIEPSTNYLIRFLRTDFSNLNVCWRPLQLPPVEKEKGKNDFK